MAGPDSPIQADGMIRTVPHTLKSILNPGRIRAWWGRRGSSGRSALCLIAHLGIAWGVVPSTAQTVGNNDADAEVLTRGPVHEAFAGIVTYNPEPGIVISKAPPEAIEELPPGQRPEGANVTWIPGYWGWDDERGDFIWISGTWRALPPGRQWIVGYWSEAPRGFQWTSGYWADAAEKEITYLPAPPKSLEVGPNVVSVSVDDAWTPGYWAWQDEHYAWSPGYWAPVDPEWSWIPVQYVWTPRGYIYSGGYWDYPVERRGIVFAPVYFHSGYYQRSGYRYSPSIVIGLDVFSDHLFLRPSYHHYYFGDYYSTSYRQSGFYASFSFGTSRFGYDPIYSHRRWEHRGDRNWEVGIKASYQYRSEHQDARPPRTWAAQSRTSPGGTHSKYQRNQVGVSIDTLAKSREGTVRLQAVSGGERQNLASRSQDIKKSRDERRALESAPSQATSPRQGGTRGPDKAKLPSTPIAAVPGETQVRAPALPPSRQSSKADTKGTPKTDASGNSPKRGDTGTQPGKGKETAPKEQRPGGSDVKPGTDVPRRPADASGNRIPGGQGQNGNRKDSPSQAKPAPAGELPPAPAARVPSTTGKPGRSPDGETQNPQPGVRKQDDRKDKVPDTTTPVSRANPAVQDVRPGAEKPRVMDPSLQRQKDNPSERRSQAQQTPQNGRAPVKAPPTAERTVPKAPKKTEASPDVRVEDTVTPEQSRDNNSRANGREDKRNKGDNGADPSTEEERRRKDSR